MMNARNQQVAERLNADFHPVHELLTERKARIVDMMIKLELGEALSKAIGVYAVDPAVDSYVNRVLWQQFDTVDDPYGHDVISRGIGLAAVVATVLYGEPPDGAALITLPSIEVVDNVHDDYLLEAGGAIPLLQRYSNVLDLMQDRPGYASFGMAAGLIGAESVQFHLALDKANSAQDKADDETFSSLVQPIKNERDRFIDTAYRIFRAVYGGGFENYFENLRYRIAAEIMRARMLGNDESTR